jgi:hypothetical protein
VEKVTASRDINKTLTFLGRLTPPHPTSTIRLRKTAVFIRSKDQNWLGSPEQVSTHQADPYQIELNDSGIVPRTGSFARLETQVHPSCTQDSKVVAHKEQQAPEPSEDFQ